MKLILGHHENQVRTRSSISDLRVFGRCGCLLLRCTTCNKHTASSVTCYVGYVGYTIRWAACTDIKLDSGIRHLCVSCVKCKESICMSARLFRPSFNGMEPSSHCLALRMAHVGNRSTGSDVLHFAHFPQMEEVAQ
jgi:hypothetical protein